MNRLSPLIVLISVLASVSLSCSSGGDSPKPTETTAAAATSYPPCRSDVLAHVRQPERLEVVDSCFSASGTVREVRNEVYDTILVEPDAQYAGILAPSNNGLLAVEITPVDEPSLFIPEVGQHATFYGARVLDS